MRPSWGCDPQVDNYQVKHASTPWYIQYIPLGKNNLYPSNIAQSKNK